MSFKLKNKPMQWKRISQVYKKATHRGIDLAAPVGTPVYATADGTVVAAKYGAWDSSYGNMVAIYHGHGTYTNHAHLSKIKTRVGKKVKAGDLIGYCGSTGRSTGPHLHFEIHLGRKWNRVDPKPYLDKIGKKTTAKKAASAKAEPFKAEKTYTLQANMNVRADHAKASKKLGQLHKGHKVHTIGVYKSGNGSYWVSFLYGGQKAWICAKSGKAVYLK